MHFSLVGQTAHVRFFLFVLCLSLAMQLKSEFGRDGCFFEDTAYVVVFLHSVDDSAHARSVALPHVFHNDEGDHVRGGFVWDEVQLGGELLQESDLVSLPSSLFFGWESYHCSN